MERQDLIRVAVCHAANQEWNSAHEIVQDIDSPEAAWVHAYLHRVEGDDGNASYWYRRAARPFPSISLEEELVELVRTFDVTD